MFPSQQSAAGSSAATAAASVPAHPGPETDDTGLVRVGVLIHVPQPLAGHVAQVRGAVTEDPITVPTHVTLVPPAALPEADLAAFAEHLGRVAALVRPFELRLCGTGTFQPVTDVAYLRVVEGADACDRLQGRLRAGPQGIDLRYPYHPHVTLAHDVPQDALDLVREQMSSVDETFTVDRFVLHVERPGQEWEQETEFALPGPDDGASV